MDKIFKIQHTATSTPNSKIAYHKEPHAVQHFFYQCRRVGYEYNKQGYYIERANGVTYLLAYTKSGEATVTYEGETVTVTAGSVLFLSQALPSIISAPSTPWEIYFVHMFGPEIDTIYNAFYQKNGCCLKNFDPTKLIENFMTIYDLYQSPEVNYTEVSGLLYATLMDLLNQSKLPKQDYVISKAIDYIEEHYAEPFDINALSQYLFLSKSHFIHKFHKQTGLSPKRYLTKVRVQKAKRYLAQSQKSIAEIAQLSGFQNEKNIYYAFKSEVGCSPTEFRSNLY